jgi:hypothetical protein
METETAMRLRKGIHLRRIPDDALSDSELDKRQKNRGRMIFVAIMVAGLTLIGVAYISVVSYQNGKRTIVIAQDVKSVVSSHNTELAETLTIVRSVAAIQAQNTANNKQTATGITDIQQYAASINSSLAALAAQNAGNHSSSLTVLTNLCNGLQKEYPTVNFGCSG